MGYIAGEMRNGRDRLEGVVALGAVRGGAHLVVLTETFAALVPVLLPVFV